MGQSVAKRDVITVRRAAERRGHEPDATLAKWLRPVVTGYFQYHAAPRMWLGALRRRGQRRPFPGRGSSIRIRLRVPPLHEQGRSHVWYCRVHGSARGEASSATPLSGWPACSFQAHLALHKTELDRRQTGV